MTNGHTWDPERYLAYADERGRPFLDLLARVGATSPDSVVDLGCGPGNLTRLLAERWPDARVTGLDSSPEMIAKAREIEGPATLSFDVADLRDWVASSDPDPVDGNPVGGNLVGDNPVGGNPVGGNPVGGNPVGGNPVDVLVSNATLQWVPGHLALLPDLVARVRPGGWLAFQVPANFDEPSHTIRAELAARPPYAEHLRGIDHPASHGPEVYLDALAGLGCPAASTVDCPVDCAVDCTVDCTVDVWETTYLHVLQGPDPVFTWVSGTGARPTLEALGRVGLREEFEVEFRAALAAAYPPHEYGVVLPFRRVFVVAQVAARLPAEGRDR